MFQDITAEGLLELQQKKNLTLIDVRSPSEFLDGTIPGSVNIPFFDDVERAEIGTLYKQAGIQDAKEKGLELVSKKLPDFVRAFQHIENEKVVYCWRGGMRSKTSATLLSLMGIRVYRLAGGIRAYRKWVVDTLEHFELNPAPIVLNGNTGTGKTAVLKTLQQRGYPILDLESMAGHRGSIFGEIGLKASNQKQFEYQLVHELLQLQDRPCVLFEAESKRIGKVSLPDFLIRRKEQAVHIYLEMPLEERVRNIVADYEPDLHKNQILHAYQWIKPRIHTPVAKQIEKLLYEEQYMEAVKLLLVYYYDPRYEYTVKQYNEPVRFKVNNTAEAIEAITEFLETEFPTAKN